MFNKSLLKRGLGEKFIRQVGAEAQKVEASKLSENAGSGPD